MTGPNEPTPGRPPPIPPPRPTWPPPPGTPSLPPPNTAGPPPGAVYGQMGYAMAAPRTEGLAIASLVCSIAAWVLCGIFGGPLAVAGVICGHIALRRIRESMGAKTGEGLAKAGVIVGWINIAVTIIAVIALIVLIANGAFDSSTTYYN